jgi:hypothetical protein
MAKLTTIANVNCGYFGNDENISQKAEVLEEFLRDKFKDPEWVSDMQDNVEYDSGTPFDVSDAHEAAQALLDAWSDANTFTHRGQKATLGENQGDRRPSATKCSRACICQTMQS